MKKKNRTFLLVLLALVILIGGSAILYSRLSSGYSAGVLTGEAPEPSATGEELPLAPDFTVYDHEGNEVSLSDFLGKPVVLNFWASWCGPCKREMPDFDSAYQELDGEVHFLMVNVTDGGRETVETASELIDEEGYTFPVYYDSDLSASTAYGVYSLPTTYFIDAEGHAVARASGSLDMETLQAGIDMITE